jgi:aspartyl-tRNA(Asn)/glutamyl-tRNA(Gln) amidotransferase subunit C
MHLDENLILHLEKLTRLELDAEARQKLLTDLNHMLKLVEQMNRLDTTRVEPLAWVNAGASRLREDLVSAQSSREEALQNAPDSDGHYFRTPKVIHHKGGAA